MAGSSEVNKGEVNQTEKVGVQVSEGGYNIVRDDTGTTFFTFVPLRDFNRMSEIEKCKSSAGWVD